MDIFFFKILVMVFWEVLGFVCRGYNLFLYELFFI